MSAIALTATLLPSASLFASAADEEVNISLISDEIAFDGEWDQTELKFELPSDGTYEVTIGYRGNGNATFKAYVDEVQFSEEGNWLGGSEGWIDATSYRSQQMTLSEGEHTLSLQGSDYAHYVSATVKMVGFKRKVSPQLGQV